METMSLPSIKCALVPMIAQSCTNTHVRRLLQPPWPNLRRICDAMTTSRLANLRAKGDGIRGRRLEQRLYIEECRKRAPPPRTSACRQNTRPSRLFGGFEALFSGQPESPKSAACGSPPRRAYRPYRRRGRVAEGGGLLNRYRVVKPYRGFESLRLRQKLS